MRSKPCGLRRRSKMGPSRDGRAPVRRRRRRSSLRESSAHTATTSGVAAVGSAAMARRPAVHGRRSVRVACAPRPVGARLSAIRPRPLRRASGRRAGLVAPRVDRRVALAGGQGRSAAAVGDRCAIRRLDPVGSEVRRCSCLPAPTNEVTSSVAPSTSSHLGRTSGQRSLRGRWAATPMNTGGA